MINLSDFGINAYLELSLRTADKTILLEMINNETHDCFIYSERDVFISLTLSDRAYELSVKSEEPVSVSMRLTVNTKETGYHIIPCNIHGDNNLKNAKPGFFPNLTTNFPEFDSSSSEWEFRADRASHPVSMVYIDDRTYGISIEPYSQDSDGSMIRNGVISTLPASIGVSLGYRNYPVTFTFKETFDEATYNLVHQATVSGKFYEIIGNRIASVSEILRDSYNTLRECPLPSNNPKYYLNAFLDSYENINWSQEWNAFTNMECQVPDSPELKPWRPLIATGWTGTGILAYPLLSAQKLLGIKNSFTDKLIKQLDSVANSINPETGLFYDLTKEIDGSRFNGWWAGYMVKDCHCAYTNGNGAYYLLKSYLLMKDSGIENSLWLSSARSVLDSINSIQTESGNYGYTYSTTNLKITDPDGFAGCWFAGANALMYKITGDNRYLDSADKAMDYYYSYVKNLDCWGAPMDTWKSIDQEGNLAFIKAASVLHKVTGLDKYKKMLIDGAGYEYLWRYAFRAYPEYAPLKDSGWNSCGGSVTSVSNPHIHPMGANVTAELIYLYNITGDKYHLNRAEDGLCWGLASADMYPEKTGYGKPGVLTERWCPSDGLVIEKFSDTKEPSSIWFTFNGWAGVSVIEGLTEPFISGITEKSMSTDPSVHDIFNINKSEVSI